MKIFKKNKIKKIISLMLCLSVPSLPLYADAQGWTPIHSYTSQSMSSMYNLLNRYNLSQNKIYVNNNSNLVLVKGQINNGLFNNTIINSLKSGAPVVFGVYDSESNIGQIFIDSLVTSPTNHTSYLIQKQFTPADGVNFSSSFENIGNPFSGMENSSYPNFFTNLSYNAFVTIMGLVIQRTNAATGWVSSDDTTYHQWTTKSGWFIVTRTYHLQALTTPVWDELLPINSTGVNDYTGFVIPVASSLQEVQSNYKSNTIGTPVQMSNGQGGLKVNAGVTAVPCSKGCTMPTGQFQSAYTTASTRGFGLLGGILTFALGGLIAYVFTKLGNPTSYAGNGTNADLNLSSSISNVYNSNVGLPTVDSTLLLSPNNQSSSSSSSAGSTTTSNNQSEGNTILSSVQSEYSQMSNSINSNTATANINTNSQSQDYYNQTGSSKIQRELDPIPQITQNLMANSSGESGSMNPYGTGNEFGQGIESITPSTPGNPQGRPSFFNPQAYSNYSSSSN